MSVAALVLGIISLVIACFGFLAGPLSIGALIMGIIGIVLASISMKNEKKELLDWSYQSSPLSSPLSLLSFGFLLSSSLLQHSLLCSKLKSALGNECFFNCNCLLQCIRDAYSWASKNECASVSQKPPIPRNLF